MLAGAACTALFTGSTSVAPPPSPSINPNELSNLVDQLKGANLGGPPKMVVGPGDSIKAKIYSSSSGVLAFVGSKLPTGMGSSGADVVTGIINTGGEIGSTGVYGTVKITLWFSKDHKTVLGMAGELIATQKGSEMPDDTAVHPRPIEMTREDIIENLLNDPKMLQSVLKDFKE